MRSKNNRQLFFGDRVFCGSHHGTILDFIGLTALIKWDCHNGIHGDSTCVHNSLVKFTEEDFAEFLTSSGNPGKRFLIRFGMSNIELWNETCPGKAKRMIIDNYASQI